MLGSLRAMWLRAIAACAGFALSLAVASARPDPVLPPPKPVEETPVPPLTTLAVDLSPIFPEGTLLYPIDLATALRLADASNPAIAVARRRVDEALARQDQAEVLWLPTLNAGGAYQRHDGQIQNSNGLVFSSNFSSLFAGGAALLHVETADAYFLPLIARRLTAAEAANSRAVAIDVQLDAAQAYLDLLQAYGALAVNTDVLGRAKLIVDRAESAFRAGVSKTTADGPRARSEYQLRLRERTDLKVRVGAASARLARILLLNPTVALLPAEVAIVPVRFVPDDARLDDLLVTGLTNRPEVHANQERAAALLTRWRQARLSPLLPRLQVEYSGGTFGGGTNATLSNFAGRGDATAAAVWELHNLGFGDAARIRERRAQYEQEQLQGIEIASRVAEEITAAVYQVRARREGLGFAQVAVREAVEMWDRLEKSSFGMKGPRGEYDALEPFLAIQSIAQARGQYLNEVIDYNRAQLRLYSTLGQPPLEALPAGAPLPVQVPAAPPPFIRREP